MPRINGTTQSGSPGGSRSTANTAAVNAARTNLTGANQRLSTAKEGVSTLTSALTSIRADVTSALSKVTDANGSVDDLKAKLEALGTPQADVDRLVAQLEQLDAAIAEADKIIDEQTKIIDEQTKIIDEQTKIIEEADETIEEQDSIIEDSDTEIDKQTEIIDEQSEIIEESDAEIEDQTKIIEDSDRTIEEQDSIIDEQSKIIEDSDRTIEEQTTLIEEADRTIEEQDSIIDEQSKIIEDSDDTIREQTEIIEDSDRTIEEQSRIIEESTATIAEQDAIITESDATIAEQDAIIQQSDATIAEQDAIIEQSDATIAEQQGLIDQASTDIETEQGNIDAATADIQAADADIATAQGALDAANADVSRLNSTVSTERNAVSAAQNEYNSLNAAANQAERAARANPDDKNLAAAARRARSAANGALGRLNSAKGRLASAEQQLREAEARKAKAEADKAAAEARKAEAERRKAEAEARKADAERRKAEAEAAKAAAEEAKRAAEEAKRAAEEAKAAAEEAKAAAEQAKSDAESTKAEAETAKTEAEAAKVEAEAAKAEAETAKAEAETAKAEAETAKAEAETAKAEAEEAKSTAEEAKAEAEETKQAAEDAKAEAEDAKAEAEDAKAEAEDAKAKAEEAKAEAEQAKADAEEAKAEAEEAKAKAEEAKAEAEQRKADAEKAKQAAEDAKAAAEKAKEAAEADKKQAEADKTKAEKEKADADEKVQELTKLQGELEAAQAKADAAKAEHERLKQQEDAKAQELEAANQRIAAAEAEVASAQAALDQAEANASNDNKDDDAANVAGDADGNGILSDAERNALVAAGKIDELPQAERDKLLQQQADLIAAEEAARARYAALDGTVENADDAEAQQRTNDRLRTQAEQEIIDERRRYYEQNPYYVDPGSGDVMVASVDKDGNLVLNRRDNTPPKDGNPELNTARTTTIQTNRNRTDVAVTTNVPKTPEEPKQTRTETIHSDPKGGVTGSQLKLEQEQSIPGGGTERSLSQEDYDARGVATQRIQEQSKTSANGDETTDRVTTNFQADGTTAASMVVDKHEKVGQAVTDTSTSTWFETDGATPSRQVVEESGTDASGAELPGTRAETEYASGKPANTYITRTGELAEGTPPSEYVVWGADNEPTSRTHGGPDTTRDQFREYLADGTQPPLTEVPDEPEALSFAEWKAQREAAGERVAGGYAAQHKYNEYVEQFEETTLADWKSERDRIEAENEASRLSGVDADYIAGATNPIEYTRQSNNRFEGRELGANLVDPLEPAQDVPSVFEVPAQLRAAANAAAIDQSKYATDPAALAQLREEQSAYEQQLAAASSAADRERIMREYFSSHDYYIHTPPANEDGTPGEPVLMASAWSNGVPYSTMFGGARASVPHATHARTGQPAVDDVGNDATLDVVINQYVDGTSDEIARTSYAGPAGASREVVTGRHRTAEGVIVEEDRHAETMKPRVEQGLPPLAITEISKERFNAASGMPEGEQYYAVATSDATTTSLEERHDLYGADGIIDDTKIESVQMSRNFDEDLTGDFLDANARAIQQARDDDFNPNDDSTSITVPPAGSYMSRSSTDIDYDAQGNAIFQQVDEESTTVRAAGDENGNGVTVTTTESSRTAGSRGGTTPIFDENDQLVVPEDVSTTIRTSEYDPDAGTAGGNKNEGHQFRETTEVTTSMTRNPDGTFTNHVVSPVTTRTLREGFDDDWVFDERQIETRTTADGAFEVVTKDDGSPKYTGEHIHHEDLDAADKFEEFMEGWGGRIVGGLAIVAGVAGAVFTGGASLALTAVGVGLASTSLAYTALNYSQGEASGWDLALSGAGVALAGVGFLGSARSLAVAGRAAKVGNAARAAGASDDIARGLADDVFAQARTGAATRAVQGAEAAETGLDGLDAYDATRAALQGDFWGAGMMLLAVGGGAAGGRIRGRINAPSVPDVPSTPALPDRIDTATGTPSLVGSANGAGPATSTGAPAVNLPGPGNGANGAPAPRPLTGSNTGSSTGSNSTPTPNASPANAGATANSEVGSARGAGDAAPVEPAPGILPDAGARPFGHLRASDMRAETVIFGDVQHSGLRLGGNTPSGDLVGTTHPVPDSDLGFQQRVVDSRVDADGNRIYEVRMGADRPLDVENVLANNPGLFTGATGRPGLQPIPGGPSAVRANPQLLAGRHVSVDLGHGQQRLMQVSADGRNLVDVSARHFEVPESELQSWGISDVDPVREIARRQQTDPSFDGTGELTRLVNDDPASLIGQTVRIRRSDAAVGEGRAIHRTSDGWRVTDYSIDPVSGESSFVVQRRNTQDHAQTLEQTVTAAELVRLNRARFEGDHGQLPPVEIVVDGVRYPDAASATRALGDDRAVRAQQNLEAFHDWYYATHGRAPVNGRPVTIEFSSRPEHANNAFRSGDRIIIGQTNDGRGAAFSPGVLAHESGHGILAEATGVGGGRRNEASAVHEAVADYYNAAFEEDWAIGRGFSADGQVIRDVSTGAGLVQNYDQYMRQGAIDARAGVRPHSGSGVLSIGLRDISGDIGFEQTTSLLDATINDPALRGDLDFRTFSDTMRRQAISRWGIDDPRTQSVLARMEQQGLVPRPEAGTVVTRLTSRGGAEYGLTVVGRDANGGVLVDRRLADGTLQRNVFPASHLAWDYHRNPNDRLVDLNQTSVHEGAAVAGARGEGAGADLGFTQPTLPGFEGLGTPGNGAVAGVSGLTTPGTPVRFDQPGRIDHPGLPDTIEGGLRSQSVTEDGWISATRVYTADGQRIVDVAMTGRPDFDPALVDAPRPTLADAEAVWNGSFATHASKHLSNYTKDSRGNYEAPSRAVDGDAAYFERSMDYRDMALGRHVRSDGTVGFEDGVEAYVRGNGAVVMINRRTHEYAVVNPDGTMGTLQIPQAGKNQAAFDRYVSRDLAGDALLRYERDARLSGRADAVNAARMVLRNDGDAKFQMKYGHTMGGELDLEYPTARFPEVDEPLMAFNDPDDVVGPTIRGPLDPLPAASRPRVLYDGDRAMGALNGLIGSATQRITGDVFVLSGDSVGRLRSAATDRGIQLNLLVDPERGGSHRAALDGTDANLVDYGVHDPKGTGEQSKVHSKVLTADGERALITTAAFMDGSADRRELSFAYDGEVAADLESWTLASMAGDQAAMRDAAAKLEQHDIYVNDPLNGGDRAQQRRLRTRVLDMIDRAESSIRIATKNLEERVSVMQLIAEKQAQRAADGLPPLEVSILDQRNSHGAGVHGTIVIVDGREAYTGTAFLARKAMDGKKGGGGRQSREIGIVTADPATVAEMQRAWNGFVQTANENFRRQAAPPTPVAQPFAAAAADVALPEIDRNGGRRLARLFGR